MIFETTLFLSMWSAYRKKYGKKILFLKAASSLSQTVLDIIYSHVLLSVAKRIQCDEFSDRRVK